MRTLFVCSLLLAFPLPCFAAPDRLGDEQDPLPEGAVARMGSPRFHHLGPVYSLAFSPNGEQLVSAGYGKTVIWDFESGVELHRFPATPIPTQVAFSPDGAILAMGTAGGEIQLVNAASGKSIRTIQANDTTIHALTFAPNGKWLASAGVGKPVRLWEVDTGRKRFELSGHSHNVMGLAFSPDSSLLASGGYDSNVILWDATSGKKVRTLHDFTQPVNDVAFSPDGKTIAMGGETSGGPESAVYLWETDSGKLIRKMAPVEMDANGGYTMNSVQHVSFHPDGARLISFGWGGLQIWDTKKGSLENTYPAAGGQQANALSPDGRYAASGGYFGFGIWDFTTGRARTAGRHLGAVTSVAISSDGKTIASAVEGFGPVLVSDAITGRHLRTLACYGRSVAFRPDSTELAVTEYSTKGSLVFFDSTTGKRTRELPAGDQSFDHVAFGRAGKLLATSNYNGEVILFDPDSGKKIREMPPSHLPQRGFGPSVRGPQNMGGLSFSTDGRRLVSSTEWKDVFVWDTSTGAQRRRLNLSPGVVTSVAISPDGKKVATSGNELVIWDEATGERLHTIESGDQIVSSVAFSPDGRWLASGGYDKTVRIWSVHSGEQGHVFKGHLAEVMAVAYSADGTRILSGGGDGWVLVWDAGEYNGG